MRVPAGPGWVLVGDASVHQDPWTGAGMDTAGRHAVMAADAVADWLSGHATEEDVLRRYHRDRDEHVLADWTECTSLARDLSQLGSVPDPPPLAGEGAETSSAAAGGVSTASRRRLEPRAVAVANPFRLLRHFPLPKRFSAPALQHCSPENHSGNGGERKSKTAWQRRERRA